MKSLSYPAHSISEDWYALPGRLRARLLFYITALLALGNLAAFGQDLFLDRGLSSVAYGLVALSSAFLAFLQGAVLFGEPYHYPPTKKKIRALSTEDLDLLELLIETGGDIISGATLYAAVDADRAASGQEPLARKRIQGQLAIPEIVKAIRRLRQAGLVRDCRSRLYEDGVWVRASAAAPDLLEQERARRSRIAAISPRSRPGPLAG